MLKITIQKIQNSKFKNNVLINKKRYLINSLLSNILIIIIIILITAGCTTKKLFYSSPTLLPGVKRNMKSPGFWISHHPYPDKIILNNEEIKQLNLYIQEKLKCTLDISQFSNIYSGQKLKTSLKKYLKYFQKRKLYLLRSGKKADKNFYNQLTKNMNLNNIPSEIKVQFGIIVNYADQRIFPTNEKLYSDPYNFYFDILQNSALDIGTPLAILHKTADDNWYYATGPSSSGWVQSDKIGLCSLPEMKKFLNQSNFIINIKSKSEIYLDSTLTNYYDYIRMGTKLSIYSNTNTNTNMVQVHVPIRKINCSLTNQIGYIKKSEIHEGYLPYTPRNIIQQAFKLLNDPYGWGGMYGEQDCSKFIQEIFSTVGLQLPRNSSLQAQVGKLITQFSNNTTEKERLEIINTKAISGITILQLQGHIMLYLGSINYNPYVIHATWGYSDKNLSDNIIRVINHVVVSDLSLGKDSEKKSHLERLKTVRNISK